MTGSLARRFILLKKYLAAQQGIEAEMATILLESIWNDMVVLWNSEAPLDDSYEPIPGECE